MLANVHSFSSDAMGPLASLALHVAIGGYLLAALLAIGALLLPSKLKMAAADIAGVFSTIALGLFFAARFAEAGTQPLGSMFEVIALSAMFLALAYFAAMSVKRLPGVGAFAFPALAVIFLVDYLFAVRFPPGSQTGPEQPLLVVHIVLIVLSYGVYFMAAVAAAMYLLQERQLKLHREPRWTRNFPSLEALSRLVSTCVQIGLPLLTIGFALGFAAFTPEDWAGLARNSKVLSGLVLWVVLVGISAGRFTGYLYGRRHFYWVLVGFVLVLFTFVGLGLYTAAQAERAKTSPLAREAH
ncbi:MAG: cytochrome c biogenesis protein CcsA [Planctomycetes bacterium]|nr:cytochrome c biogenesis protein CcsA [Planctomycetota bacterium]